MLTGKQKIKYLLDSFLASGQKMQCPFCGGQNCQQIDRKYLVTSLMECQNCHLYFRYPVDKKEVNTEFYQTQYKEKDKITTDLPDDLTLKQMIDEGFKMMDKNADRYLNLFSRLFPGEKTLRIIDYGCSWGYQTYQYKQAGHKVQGFEISRSRAEFGIKKLDIEIALDENLLRSDNHIFFSSHVIEHHPDISAMISLAEKLLIKGGYFVAFCPNGSPPFKLKQPQAFHHAWGKVHPSYLSGDFYKYVFKKRPYYIGSSPIQLEKIHPLQPHETHVDDLSGEELLIVSKFC